MPDDHDAILVELRYIREAQDRLLDGQAKINGRVRATEIAIAEVRSEAKNIARVAGTITGGLSGTVTALAAYFGIGR